MPEFLMGGFIEMDWGIMAQIIVLGFIGGVRAVSSAAGEPFS